MKNNDLKEQFDRINAIVTDKEEGVYHSYQSLILWSILSAMMILGTPYVNVEYGLNAMGIYLFAVMAIGFSVDILYIKKFNRQKETITTPNQKFTAKIWTINTIFAIILTNIFVKNLQIEFIYPVWLFFIGMSNYVTSHTFKLKNYYNIGAIASALIIFASSGFFEDKVPLYYAGIILSLLFLSLPNLIIGLQIRAKSKNV